MSEQQTDDGSQELLMRQYLEQTEIEVRTELQILQLEKELTKLRNRLSETRLTKTNLMNKLKGLPEAAPMDPKIEELLRKISWISQPPKDPFRL